MVPLIAPVVDACVLMDMYLTSRPRRQHALELAELMLAQGLSLRVPMFALFEVHAALKGERRDQRIPLDGPNLLLSTVTIDEAFFNEYFDPDLPYIKAGDLVYLSIAKREQRPLVTEDKGLHKAAIKAGVAVFNIRGYLNHFSSPT